MAVTEERIYQRKDKGGTLKTIKRYKATVTVKGFPRVSKTFNKKGDADEWGKKTEYELKYQLSFGQSPNKTVGDAINRYSENIKKSNPKRHKGITITRLADDMTKVHLRFGFKELPDIQGELLRLQKRKDGLDFDWENTSVFLSRKTLRAHSRYGLPFWQDLFYTWMYKNATDPTDFYRLPIGRVIELGRHAMI